MAVSRLLDELPAGAAARARAAAARVRAVAARLAGAPGRDERGRRAARVPAREQAGRVRRSRCSPGWRWPVRWRSPPAPDRTRWRSGSRSPRSCSPSDVRSSGGDSPDSRRCSGSRSGSRPRSARCSPSPRASGCASRSGTARGRRCFAPFVIAAPGALAHDLFGFYGIQNLQRLPFPLGFDGPLRPSKLIEFYMPAILVLSCVVWAAALGSRARTAARSRAALRAGIGTSPRPTPPGARVARARAARRRRTRVPARANRRVSPHPAVGRCSP